MEWDRLLSPRRIRELMDGPQSQLSDHRSEFQRDFDRVVFSTPVRRLQDKAQVFPLEPNDSVRTRLTHSLEVSAVARGIVTKVGELLGKDHDFTRHLYEIATIAATVGLVHDLGNPPFGHFGEEAIRGWFREPTGVQAIEPLQTFPQLLGDFNRYEGNAHTLRLLCSLQLLADPYGLNLTAATVSAATKYIASSDQVDESDHARSKPGFLFAEQDVVSRVAKEVGTSGKRNPIAYLVEAADDCVYSLCDLEDAVRKRVLSWSELRTAIVGAVEEKSAKDVAEKQLLRAEEHIDTQLREGKFDLQGNALDSAYVQMLRTRLIGVAVEGAAKAFVERYTEIMDGRYTGELVKDKDSAPGGQLIQACKTVGQKKVYCTRENTELELRGRRVIHDLLDLLWLGVKGFDGKDPRPTTIEGKSWALLSESYRGVFRHSWARIADVASKSGVCQPALRQYYKLLLVTDYVAGMTDSFACALHRSLHNG